VGSDEGSCRSRHGRIRLPDLISDALDREGKQTEVVLPATCLSEVSDGRELCEDGPAFEQCISHANTLEG
jgi:hypothetical protein